MSKKLLILFAAELIAVALLRLTYMLRRDNMWLPKSGKVSKIHRTPVYRQPYVANKTSFEDEVRAIEKRGWTGNSNLRMMESTPDRSPGA